jgi:hypothetical protein
MGEVASTKRGGIKPAEVVDNGGPAKVKGKGKEKEKTDVLLQIQSARLVQRPLPKRKLEHEAEDSESDAKDKQVF